MKRFDSGTLIPGSTGKAEAESEAEVVRRAVENLKNFHGETVVRPDMVERIKERIVDVDAKGATKHCRLRELADIQAPQKLIPCQGKCALYPKRLEPGQSRSYFWPGLNPIGHDVSARNRKVRIW